MGALTFLAQLVVHPGLLRRKARSATPSLWGSPPRRRKAARIRAFNTAPNSAAVTTLREKKIIKHRDTDEETKYQTDKQEEGSRRERRKDRIKETMLKMFAKELRASGCPSW